MPYKDSNSEEARASQKQRSECNIAIGQFNDDPRLAAEYLERHLCP